MTDCPTCEYHKQRAQLWRDEVYRLAGHPLPRKGTMTEDDDDIQDYKKPWVGLTGKELELLCDEWRIIYGAYVEEFAKDIEAKLKEKNA